jgi:protein O-mannosyl-transferase
MSPGTLLRALLIVALGFWIYWPVFQGDWLWDDNVLVAENFDLHTWEGLWRSWFARPSTDYWPFTWTLLWIDWHLWGKHPLGYHLCTLVLHLFSAFLIWRLFWRLGLRWAWLAGLFFVVHPLMVESVAWISEIKNTFSLPFFLLSLLAWLDFEDGKSSGYLRSVLYYLAAMLAKTSTVMLPLVLLLYCWWKRGRITSREIKHMIPFAVIAVVLGAVTVYFQTPVANQPLVELGGFVTRLIGAGTALCFYLGKFILPVILLPIYPQWVLNPPSLLQMLTIPIWACLLLGLWTLRNAWGRHALFGFGFFLLNLLPVLGFVQMQYLRIAQVADHLAYLPIIGLIGLVVAGLESGYGRMSASIRPLSLGITAMVVLLLVWKSRANAALFVNEETLWNYTLRYNPEAWVAHNGLGNALMRSGKLSAAKEQYDLSIKIYPEYAVAHNNLGLVLMQTGEVSEAMRQYRQALKLDPNYFLSYNNLGNALLQTGRASEAMEQYERALKINPDYVDAHYNLGNTLIQTGHESEAMQQYQQALEIDPDYAPARYNLGNELLQSGRVSEAIEQYEEALRAKPDYAAAHSNLGDALLQTRRVSEAITQYEQALEINPNLVQTHNNLAVALFHSGRITEAITQYEQALEINPNLVQTHNNLAIALFHSGRITEAIEQFVEVLRIDPHFINARDNLAKLQALQKAAPSKN